jgi:hypothetical protein
LLTINNLLDKKDRVQREGALVSRRVNRFLTKLMTGNKSGAALLTNIRLTCTRATGDLPLWRGDTSSASLPQFALRRLSRRSGVAARDCVTCSVKADTAPGVS